MYTQDYYWSSCENLRRMMLSEEWLNLPHLLNQADRMRTQPCFSNGLPLLDAESGKSNCSPDHQRPASICQQPIRQPYCRSEIEENRCDASMPAVVRS
jgi:hypothetical protein